MSTRPSPMLVRRDPETAPLCPQCGDAMRLARKLPAVRPLSGLVVHLCGRCGYVQIAEREPDPPPPKWLQPKRGARYSQFGAGTQERPAKTRPDSAQSLFTLGGSHPRQAASL
jgi:ribosomal protein S27AE